MSNFCVAQTRGERRAVKKGPFLDGH